VLELQDIEVYYGNIRALKGVSLRVGDGEVVALIGNNGAGKTTTLRTISGLLRPRSGAILLNGRRIDGMPPHSITKMGIGHVLEGRQIFANLTVMENLIVGAYLNPSKSAVEADLEKVFALFPVLKERKNQHGGTLSGGEQQMLAVARALMGNPRLLLMDEPSLGLAPVLVEQVAGIIRTIKDRGIPILLVEQNARLALALAHRGYVLESGEIVLEGTADSLRDNDMVKKAYLGI
jgi:branched-chain amino acid transport system ATP-binding protein